MISNINILGHFDIVKDLSQDSRVNPSDNHDHALRLASQYGSLFSRQILTFLTGHLPIVEILLADTRTNPGNYFNFAVREASSNGHAEVVAALLKDSRVDPSANCNAAIRFACLYGKLFFVTSNVKFPAIFSKKSFFTKLSFFPPPIFIFRTKICFPANFHFFTKIFRTYSSRKNFNARFSGKSR
jgi:hypothetical protein